MDFQLYSRQLYVLGREAQERVQGSKILIFGNLNGLGVEIAKNVALAGVHSLTICDDSKCRLGDLASNFFISEEDVRNGVKRSEAVISNLKELNNHVIMDVCSESSLEFTEQGIGRFGVVVLVNGTREEISKVDVFCHNHQPLAIGFIATGMYGLYGYTFCDFGPTFMVLDVDGEATKHGIVVNVEPQEEDWLLITTADDSHHGLVKGDSVIFKGINGSIDWLNDGSPRQIEPVQIHNSEGKLVDGYAFRVSSKGVDDSIFSYEGGGHFEQVKTPKDFHFNSFDQSNKDPELILNDWNDLELPKKLHAYLNGLWDFMEKKSRLPKPGSEEDVEELKKFIKFDNEDDIKLVCALGKGAAGNLNPMAAYFGGITAQEVLKACSGKFSPIQQWLHYAAPQCLSDDANVENIHFPTLEELDGNEIKSEISRYAGQAAVFGWEFQEKLAQMNCFMVGAGALGCESLKNLALMGVSTKKGESKLIVTDMDAIETSNLNRQFLFRPHHVGKMKSVVASEMSRKMNPSFQVKAMEIKVGPETENTFSDAFWENIDIVVNALDNVNARMYVDSKCLFYQKPLFESGTLGTKANTLPIIPNMTQSYSTDPVQENSKTGGEGDIPACTLHAYPNLIEHTLTWARDAVFEKYFNVDPTEGQLAFDSIYHGKFDHLMKDLNRQPSTKLQRLRMARGFLVGMEPSDHVEKLFPYHLPTDKLDLTFCIRLARLRFEELFVNKIKQLLAAHPLDKTVDDKGTLFWSGKRRPPAIEYFNLDDPLHYQFIHSTAFLYGKVYGILQKTQKFEKETILTALEGFSIPEFKCDDNVVIPENDEQAKALKEAEAKKLEEEQDESSFAQECEKEISKLQTFVKNSEMLNINPQEFDKDDESNGHMDVIFAAASIRGRSYGIPLIDQLEAKRIVGRIIPAIATTTAMTTGAIALEIYKFLQNHRIEKFRCSNINLAVNSYALFEPTPCDIRYFGKKKYIKDKVEEKIVPVSVWSMITLTGNLTIQEIIDYFLEKYEFEVMNISTKGDVVLYNDMFDQEDRLEMTISALYEQVTNSKPPYFIILNVDGDFEIDDDDEDDDDDDDEEEDLCIPACRIKWNI